MEPLTAADDNAGVPHRVLLADGQVVQAPTAGTLSGAQLSVLCGSIGLVAMTFV